MHIRTRIIDLQGRIWLSWRRLEFPMPVALHLDSLIVADIIRTSMFSALRRDGMVHSE